MKLIDNFFPVTLEINCRFPPMTNRHLLPLQLSSLKPLSLQTPFYLLALNQYHFEQFYGGVYQFKPIYGGYVLR